MKYGISRCTGSHQRQFGNNEHRREIYKFPPPWQKLFWAKISGNFNKKDGLCVSYLPRSLLASANSSSLWHCPLCSALALVYLKCLQNK